MNLFLDVFKIFWPSYAVFWIISICLATGFWFLLTKIYTQIKFKIYAPVIFASFLTTMLYAHNFLNIYNNQVLYAAQQQAQNLQNPQAQQAQQQALDPETKLKAEFLAKLEQILLSGSYTKENKTKLFKDYASLFKNAADKKLVFEEVHKVYSCQRVLWEDALASFKAKQSIKSDSRVVCEKLPGSFFKREKLFTAETLKNQDELIAKIAARKRVPASDGKEQELTEDMIRQGIEAHSLALRLLNELFQ